MSAFADADGATKIEELYKLFQNIEEYDGIIGSRWIKGAKIVSHPGILRIIAGRVYNFVLRTILGLPFKDTQCGSKVFRRHAIEDVIGELFITNFAFDAELLFGLLRKGYRIKEYPINWEHKSQSTLKLWKAAPSMFWTVIKIWWKEIVLRRLKH